MPEPLPRPGSGPETPSDPSLDERLRRLEESLSRLANTEVMEKVVAQKVLARIGNAPEGLTTGSGAAIPSAAVATAGALLLSKGSFTSSGSVWGRIPIIVELRLMVRMYLDPRYRLSRMGQFAAPVLLALMVLNYLLFNFWALPLVSWIVFPFVERLFLVVLAVVLYKVLAREAARYAAVLDYLSRYMR